MNEIWMRRLRKIALGLCLATTFSAGLAVILAAAGDRTGQAALFGVASVSGIGLVINLAFIVMGASFTTSTTTTQN